MEKKLFEKIMDEWSSHEKKSSPKLLPKEEMYRRVKGKQKRSRKWFFGPLGWTVAATAAAAVLLFVIFLPDVSKQTALPEEPAATLKEGETADEAAPRRTRMAAAKVEMMEEIKGERAFNQLYFQQQNLEDKSIVGVDIQTQRDQKVNVTPSDNYRLQVQLNAERYVYVFQFDSDQQLTQLFPNAAYNIEQNPLQEGPLYNFPAPPQWLSVNEDSEGGTIYVIAADLPQKDWELLYGRYINLRRGNEQQEFVKQFLDQLESMTKMQKPGIEVQKFVFERQ